MIRVAALLFLVFGAWGNLMAAIDPKPDMFLPIELHALFSIVGIMGACYIAFGLPDDS